MKNRTLSASWILSILVLSSLALTVANAQFAHSPNANRSDPHPNVAATDEQPAEGGVGYTWTVALGGNDSAYITGHVGAWSWQDEALFDAEQGEEPVGWTHTSNWVSVELTEDAWVTVRYQRETGVPWPSAEDPERTASIATMNPSFTIFAGYDGDGGDSHTWNNDGPVEWAEDLTYLDHVNNSVSGVVEKSWYLSAGSYTLALGSNAPSNDSDRQGYRATLTTSSLMPFSHSANAVRMDPHPNVAATDEQPAEGGVGYTWTVALGGNDSAYITGHVGAWSWQDEALFDAEQGEEPVGWTHTSNWVSVELTEDAWVTVRYQRETGVPWPSAEDPERTASIATMNPSFTIFAGYDGDGGDSHTWNNDGPVEWAEDLTYLDHVNNSVSGVVEKSWYLSAGSYTLALGSNAPSNDSDRQGYRTRIHTSQEKPSPSLFMEPRGDSLFLSWSMGDDSHVLQRSSNVLFGDAENVLETGSTPAPHTVNTDQDFSFFRLIPMTD